MGKKLTRDEALAKAANLCAKAEHSRVEIKKKLYQWGIGADECGSILDFLEDNGFVDESRFAHAFVYDKYRFDGWGRQKIRYGLRQHGISGNVAEEAMAEIDEDEYRRIFHRLMLSKYRMSDEKNPYKLKEKLYRYAFSRGYESKLAIAEIVSLVDGADDFEDCMEE